MTNHLLNMISYISEKMDEALGEVYNTGFSERTVEPSPGDVFDIYVSPTTRERYVYIDSECIVPLSRISKNSTFYFIDDQHHETVSWDDVLYAMSKCDYEDVHLKTVFTNQKPVPTAPEIFEWIRDSVGQKCVDAFYKVSDSVYRHEQNK